MEKSVRMDRPVVFVGTFMSDGGAIKFVGEVQLRPPS